MKRLAFLFMRPVCCIFYGRGIRRVAAGYQSSLGLEYQFDDGRTQHELQQSRSERARVVRSIRPTVTCLVRSALPKRRWRRVRADPNGMPISMAYCPEQPTTIVRSSVTTMAKCTAESRASAQPPEARSVRLRLHSRKRVIPAPASNSGSDAMAKGSKDRASRGGAHLRA